MPGHLLLRTASQVSPASRQASLMPLLYDKKGKGCGIEERSRLCSWAHLGPNLGSVSYEQGDHRQVP